MERRRLSPASEAALSYAARGWPVLPVHSMQNGACSCGSRTCRSPGKHPATPRGVDNASCKELMIRIWAMKLSDANVAVATGASAGIVVIDVDWQHGGHESLAALEDEHGELPPTVEALTGGGGRHLIFAHPGGTVRNGSNVCPGIDVRGDRGYIVAPPSNHASGERYRWREGHSPDEMEPAVMPEWLLALITQRPNRGGESPARNGAPGERGRPNAVAGDRVRRAHAAMRGLKIDDHNDGSRRLYAAASIAVRHDLAESEALSTIRQYLDEAPAPRSWSDDDILRRLCDAERGTERGEALARGAAEQSSIQDASRDSVPRSAPFKSFPVEALPERMRIFAEAVATATATDPAFASLAVLVVAAGCIGNRAVAWLKDGWTEPAILWGALVGRSGTMKSPVVKLVTQAVIELFKTARREFEVAHKEHQREFHRYQAQLRKWRQQKDDASDDPPDEPECPVERRLHVTDVTVEKLASLLEQNPLGLLLIRDELAAWVGAFDRYASSGKGSDQPAWLSMYDAAPTTIDRKSGGKSGKPSYFVERAAVSVLGTIQPGTLATSFGKAEREAGLLARLLLTHPPERPALWTEEGLPDPLAEDWRKLLEALLALPAHAGQNGAEPRRIPIDRAAKPSWIEWHDRHARELNSIDQEDLEAHFSKLKGACARIALVFACVDAVTTAGGAPTCIGADAISRAIDVVEWFKREGRRVYALLNESEPQRTRRELIDWIERRGGNVTVRDLTHGPQRYRGDKDAAEADLDALVNAGIGEWSSPAPGSRGGRPSKRFRLKSGSPGTKTPADDPAEGGFGCGVNGTGSGDGREDGSASGAEADDWGEV